MNRLGSNLNCRRKIKCLKIKFQNLQNSGQDRGKKGVSKVELPITEPFMNRFGSNLNPRGEIERLKIELKISKNGGQDGGQDNGSKL